MYVTVARVFVQNSEHVGIVSIGSIIFANLYQVRITQSLITFSHGRFLILQMYDHWDPEKYRYLIENILITTDSVPYTLSISIFVFPVLKNMCDCSKISCSPGKFCSGDIVRRI